MSLTLYLENGIASLREEIDMPRVILWRHQAEAIRKLAKSADMGHDVMNLAAKMKLEAERRLGQMLAILDVHPGGDQKSPNGNRILLKDIGFNKSRSSRVRKLAIFTDLQWDGFLSEHSSLGTELTSAEALRCLRAIMPSVPKRSPQKRPKRNGHPIVPDPETAPTSTRDVDQGNTVENLIERMDEVRNHFRMVVQLLEVLCSTGTTTLTPASQRVLQRYFREIDQLLKNRKRV